MYFATHFVLFVKLFTLFTFSLCDNQKTRWPGEEGVTAELSPFDCNTNFDYVQDHPLGRGYQKELWLAKEKETGRLFGIKQHLSLIHI